MYDCRKINFVDNICQNMCPLIIGELCNYSAFTIIDVYIDIEQDL